MINLVENITGGGITLNSDVYAKDCHTMEFCKMAQNYELKSFYTHFILNFLGKFLQRSKIGL